MQNAKANANLPVTFHPSNRGRGTPEAARRWPGETIAMARFGRSTDQGERIYVIAVVVTLFGWSILLILVFTDISALNKRSNGLQPMQVGIAMDDTLIFGPPLSASGLLAIWDRGDIGSTIRTIVLIPIRTIVLISVAIVLVFGYLVSILLKFCRDH